MDKGFLDQWLICGPFFSDRGWATLDEDYLFGEAVVTPRQGSRTFGREWIPFDTSAGFLQFLNAPFQHILFVTAYAHTYVYSPRDAQALLLCGSDDGIKVWLNGSPVWRNDVNRACVPDEDRAPVRLKAGWNSLLVKVRQGMAHWQFCARIVDSDQSEIADLACAREADYHASGVSEYELGVRVRFPVETYICGGGSFHRDTQLELGCIGPRECADVSLDLAGGVPGGTLKPSETRMVSARLPFAAAVKAMESDFAVHANGKAVKSKAIASGSARLLRDLFAPFFIPTGESAEPPEAMRGFGWSEFARDVGGRYLIVDPPGLRPYLAGLVGRFPMKNGDAAAARRTCDKLLALAIEGRSGDFMGVLRDAKLPALPVA